MESHYPELNVKIAMNLGAKGTESNRFIVGCKIFWRSTVVKTSDFPIKILSRAKAVPLHATKALGGGEEL
jgi:hypothetical protein